MSRNNDLFPGRRTAVAARVIVVLMIAAMLAGCGKKGNPVPPAGEASSISPPSSSTIRPTIESPRPLPPAALPGIR